MSKTNLKSLCIYIDGAARGNPGPAGAGVVITDAVAAVVKNISRYLGEATNNVAEYRALLCGLEEARELGAEELIINTDSELLARQLGGAYKVKNDTLKGLYAQAMDMLNDFQEVAVRHIPREDNKGADRLANKAIDEQAKKKSESTFFVLRSKKDKKQDTLF